MALRNSAALAVDFQPVPREVLWRLSNTIGILCVVISACMFTFAAELPAYGRMGLGLCIAATFVVAGDVLARRSERDYGWWSGTGAMIAGYFLAYFIVHTGYHVNGAPALASPYTGWLLQLAIVVAAVMQADRNSVLRWIALPFSLAASLQVFLSALSTPDTVSVFGLNATMPEVACFLGVFWFGFLSWAYKRKQASYRWEDSPLLERSIYGLYFVGEQACFLAAIGSGMLLPGYMSSFETAPLFWALEMPILLAFCWHETGFAKHALVMAAWAISSGLTLLLPSNVHVLWYMLVPLSGLAMGLAYRFLGNERPRWQTLAGYGLYIYGSAVVALAVPVVQAGAVAAMPYWLVVAAILLALGLSLRDRLLHMYACTGTLAALVMYGTHFHEWQVWLTLWTVAGCYGFCVWYGYIGRQGGLLQSEFAPLKVKSVLTALEARWLEWTAGVVGYACWMTGSLFLLHGAEITGSWTSLDFWLPLLTSNTLEWWLAGLAMVFYGLRMDRREHRVMGVASWFLATGKMWVIDMSRSTNSGALVLVAICGMVCAFSAAHLYHTAFRTSNNASPDDGDDNDPPPASGGPSGDAT